MKELILIVLVLIAGPAAYEGHWTIVGWTLAVAAATPVLASIGMWFYEAISEHFDIDTTGLPERVYTTDEDDLYEVVRESAVYSSHPLNRWYSIGDD